MFVFVLCLMNLCDVIYCYCDCVCVIIRFVARVSRFLCFGVVLFVV